jgi:ATP-binding cassette, subfamily B, bacterial
MPGSLQRLLGPLAHSSKTVLIVAAVLSGFLIALLGDLLTVLSSFLNTTVEQNMVLDFRSDLFRHAERLSLAFHDRSRAGGLVYAVNFQGDAAARLVMTIPPLAQSAITLVGMFWIVFGLDKWLALLSLSVVPLLYYSVGYYITHVQTRLMTVRAMEGESLSIVHEAISMLRVIVAFGREDYEHRRR